MFGFFSSALSLVRVTTLGHGFVCDVWVVARLWDLMTIYFQSVRWA